MQLLVHASRRDVGASIIFRFVGGIGAGAFFFVLRDRLPFPQPELSILFAVFLSYNTLLVPTLVFADRLPIRLLYVLPAYCDLGVAFAFAHFTGGYLSPFLITPLLTVIGINIVYLTDRRAGAWSFACLALGLVGMTLAHRMEWIVCPVPYAARLIRDDAFFYATFPPVLLLFTLGWLMARNTGGSIYATINDLLTTNQKLVERMAVGTDAKAGADFLRMVAESFGGDRAFLVPTSGVADDGALGAAWPATDTWGPLGSLRDMEPSRRALSAGDCLVPYGARQLFPDCAVIRRTGADGCWIAVLRNEAGSPIGLLGVLRDGPLQLDHKAEFLMKLFTVLGQTGLQRRLAEQATNAMREQLHHSQKMEALGQLAGGVAHDFNNLLTVILGASELLGVRLGDRPQLAGYARDVHAAGRRAADLVRHLLSFARRAPVEVAPVDLHGCLAEVRRLLAHTLDKRIELALDTSAPCAVVLGDASQIQNALLNVALNARDAMPEGGTLEFVTKNREIDGAELGARAPGVQPGTFIEVTCRDTGVGMTREVLERAFDPFFTTKEPGKGTGLGLAAVYGCVQAHGGFLEIDSIAGEGTSVKIVLPAVQTAMTHGRTERVGPAATAAGLRLLLADDEELVAGVMARALRQAGYEVDVCQDGAAALERYREDPCRYDLVLLDVVMPRLDGRQAFDAMQQLNPSLRCVFVSGYSDEARVGPLVAEARCGFVQKPFLLNRLLDTVRAELERAEPATSG